MDQNAVFFWNFEQDSIFQTQKAWEREKKKNWNSFFLAILDGLLSRQAKMKFFKGIFSRFKGSRLVLGSKNC